MTVILETERLILRPPTGADIPDIVRLVGDFEVSKNLATVPHPYTEKDGRDFLAKAQKGWASGEDMPFCILGKPNGTYAGMCGVHPNRNWEIGYWLGKPYWSQGYATEAASRIVAFAFDEKDAECLAAEWFFDNPASGRVLEKLGFTKTGETMSNCLARGHKVPAHSVALDHASYRTRNMTP